RARRHRCHDAVVASATIRCLSCHPAALPPSIIQLLVAIWSSCPRKAGILTRLVNWLHLHEDTFFSDSWPTTRDAECGMGRLMPKVRPTRPNKKKHAAIVRRQGRPARPSPRLAARFAPNLPVDAAEVARTRLETEAAITEARKSHERLREAIDILP